MDFKPTTFQKNLKYLLAKDGLTCSVLSRRIGIPSQTLCRYLHGNRIPDIDYAFVIAHYFEVSVDWLLGLDLENKSIASDEIQNIMEAYSSATEAERNVVKAVLRKYL